MRRALAAATAHRRAHRGHVAVVGGRAVLQGRYGLPVLRYTETSEVIAEPRRAPEVIRGLGYWLFYGTDKLGPWIEPSVTYTRTCSSSSCATSSH